MALLAPQFASAHFLWLVTESGEPAKVKVYFSEAAEPDDPALLDRIQQAQVWALTGRRGEPQPLTLTKGKDALEAELPATARNATVILRHTFGVRTRGDKSFLLNYYAKFNPSPLPGAWQKVNDAERLPLEITPRVAGSDVEFQVTWQGKPAAGATITIHGPGIDSEEETNEAGTYRWPLTEKGLYSIHARLIDAESGEHEGKSYAESRHYTTLALQYAPAQIAPAAHNLPDLPQGTTSIGGAVAGNSLYIYGGNYGDAHEYSKDGQSGDLWKLDLKTPTQWEKQPGGPRLQGLAMVEHQGRLYRVGGFTAMNEEGEPSDLRSQADVARFDPQTQAWESLPSLPSARSSHDAAVLNGVLYVVGGWNLQGESGESQWHADAVAMNLNEQPLVWRTITAPPFKRRALAVAAWQGKLYCIGGMQEQGATTTAVHVYDPAKEKWTEGPALLGGSMDGFGASAFAAGDGLYVTTISGSIQRLSGEAKAWEFMGQLDHPRFFHRLLAIDDQRLVVAGGGSMSVGKVQEIEVLNLADKNPKAP